MSYEITWQSIFDEFVFMYPGMGSEVEDWYPSGQFEITVKLSDGAKLRYHYLEKTFRFIHIENDNNPTEEEWLREFSRRLTKKMSYAYMTQEKLAELTGISTSTLSKYMNGKSIPSAYNMRRIARALKCSSAELTELIF